MSNKPTEAMAAEAERGLAWRKEYNRGGTSVGVARARDISNRATLSDKTILRMHSYFSRHEVDKKGQGFTPGQEGYPSAGRIAWALWGGDPGQSWARIRAERIRRKKKNATREKLEMPIPVPNKGETRADFMDRCMSDETMVGEYDDGQRRAICQVQAEYLDGELSLHRNAFRVAFYKAGKKTRKGYAVDVVAGTIEGVSLIQLGEAKGHGIYVDGLSLASALEVLGSANLPAFITHRGALDDDRMLKQVGYFSGFYIDQGKLKAESFQSLESFRDDQTESFNRLFDLAREMPDAFGLSLVFEAELVWVLKNGEEISVAEAETKPKAAKRDLPSVRFNSISSADFVDEPAANEDGLFSKKQNPVKIMDEEIKTEEDEKAVAFEEPEKIEDPDEESEEQDETQEQAEGEEPEEASDEESDEEPEGDELSALREELAALKAELAELKDQLSEKTEEAAKLSKELDGEEIALSAQPSPEASDAEVLEQFNNAEPGRQFHIWKQNKKQILRAARRG